MTRNDILVEIVAVAAGLFAAACVPPVLLAMVSPLGGDHDIKSIAVSSVVFFPFSFLFTVLIGLPVYLAVRPFQPVSGWFVAAAGFILGLLFIFVGNRSLPTLHGALLVGSVGMLSALVFWLVWRKAGVGREKP